MKLISALFFGCSFIPPYFPSSLPPFLCRSSVNLQDPFSEGNDPAFPRKNMTPNSAYQSGMNTPDMQGRMSTYEPNKDPFGNMRKGGRAERIVSSTKILQHKFSSWVLNGIEFSLHFQLGSSFYLLTRAPTAGWVTNRSSHRRHNNSSSSNPSSPLTTGDHQGPWARCQWDPDSSILMDQAMTGGKDPLNGSCFCYVWNLTPSCAGKEKLVLMLTRTAESSCI